MLSPAEDLHHGSVHATRIFVMISVVGVVLKFFILICNKFWLESIDTSIKLVSTDGPFHVIAYLAGESNARTECVGKILDCIFMREVQVGKERHRW